MKLMAKFFAVVMLLTAGLMAADAAKHDVRVFVSDNADKKITPATIEEAFKGAGFIIAANNNMNAPFMRDFNETSFDVYNLAVVYRKDTALALAEQYPEIGLFTPMSMSIYTKKGDNTISVSSIAPHAMARIMGVPEDNEHIIAYGKKVEEALKAAMPNGKFITLPYEMKNEKHDFITRVAFEQDGDDWEESKDNYQMGFEGELAPHGFVMAGFTDLNYDFEENDKEWFYFYDVYSICKIAVIYEVAKLHPEAGAFAPCSAYMYQKRGEKTIHVAFPNVHKWIDALNITDKPSIDVLLDAQSRFEKILATIKK
ncbi:DUF302 domain-containing protein [Sulfurovum sp. zt1-1]|uniref:DUF302 domain-containing protein n=1 Tax=Sulfurovum zhangzhouensis TaxID=3019067 RepID=A0ABT7R1P3_9BACT|nr:DUF302 domain-containing protein [Sulfurovum zhangzhouensis]MDM5272451.1 DUF302 domain-containing protein [Sulfurovum zhangzhouensis]